MARWINIWLGTADIPAEYKELINSVKNRLGQTGDYYSGWELFENDVIGHSGGTPNYSSRIVFSENVSEISGTLMLTEKGEVYDISDTSAPIDGLMAISKISCGEAHKLALDVEGVVYSWGTNTYGECGVSTTGALAVQEIYFDAIDIYTDPENGFVIKFTFPSIWVHAF